MYSAAGRTRGAAELCPPSLRLAVATSQVVPRVWPVSGSRFAIGSAHRLPGPR